MLNHNNEKRIVGVYDDHTEAIEAIEDLKRQGYNSEEISVISKERDDVEYVEETTDTKAEEGAATGAATGGILGGLAGVAAGAGALAIPGIGPIVAAGPIVAGLTGAAAGAGAGGLTGALIGLGIPEEDADRYNEYVKQGKMLVLVDRDAGIANTGTHDLGTATDRTVIRGDHDLHDMNSDSRLDNRGL
ncbi:MULTISPECIES: general stress protein [Bacillaceae]|uniref:general stress protein n=1 Tax=Bacillaceae TaxID=186817 RepID=UPI000E72CBF7|nr:general stress protein [Bacillus sp. PK3_68]RJS61511.1 general stress protein [Bacillus sp. PK3_68]